MASERKFQRALVEELKKYKWVAPEALNGMDRKVTVDDLIYNWRCELNRINADQLEGVPLTGAEFDQVLSKVGRISSSFEAAKLLAMEGSVGKIDGIYRDPHPDITRESITLTIFKKAQVRGGISSYQIATEVQSDNGSRFDMVLLINGLPLINVELKKASVSLKESFTQFKRYYQKGEYINNFMAFSQMMVMMSEVEMGYFATPKSLDDFNESFVFNWADVNNRPIHNWREVVKDFLMIPMAHQMVGDYLVIDESVNEERRKHMVMRPYQVHALRSVEAAAYGWNNDGIPQGGFVWHTTGSGKTITSFKTALFLSTRVGFDKVVFLVDRRELDSKTTEEFKAYSSYEAVSVDETRHTYQLGLLMKSLKRGIIVTTTFKLNSLVKDLLDNKDYSLRDKRIVFIIDEAHRTTMGQMMGTIKSYFKNKQEHLFYGFTGTPLFEENKVPGMIDEKSELINTTEKLFGPLLHQYTIDEAISDGNVLGFHVDYINTGEFISHDDLRNQLAEKKIQEKPQIPVREIEREMAALSPADVERRAASEELLVYYDKTHIPRVVKDILDNWVSQSDNYFFNAILTVAYKERVINYYEEFKKQVEERKVDINIAMTFSFGSENDPDQIPLEKIEEMFDDYSKFTGIKFIAGDKTRGERNYFEDLVSRSTRGGSGRNKKNIDLVIVADQLLTGYDSKYLNTLYVDRSLQLQSLIQAYSRTNRIFGRGKEFGSIVNFKYPRLTEESVNTALRLYGSGGESSRVIKPKYENAVELFTIAADLMRGTLADPTKWAEIKGTEDMVHFLEAFKSAARQLDFVRQYYQFCWDDEAFGISLDEWNRYVGAYKNLTDDEEDGDDLIVPPLPGITKIDISRKIDAGYIIRLIGEKTKIVDGIRTVDPETLRLIYQEIQEMSDLGNARQAQQLRSFVEEELIPGKIPSSLNFDEAYENWLGQALDKEIRTFSDNWGVDYDLIRKSYDSFTIGFVDEEPVVPYIEEITRSASFEKAKDKSTGMPLRHNIKLNKELPKWLAMMKRRF